VSYPPVVRAHVHPHSCSACSVPGPFCTLPEKLREILEGMKTGASYSKGQVLFHESDPCHTVSIVCEGSVKLITSSTDGRGLVLRFAAPGEILGLSEAVLGQSAYRCSAIAAEVTHVAVIPRETFMRFVSSYRELCVCLTYALSEQYKMAQRETKFLAFGGTSTSRLAHLLLAEASERGTTVDDGIHIHSHITHLELAQSIGSTRETVTRILGNLNHSGIIGRAQNEIVIRRKEELQRLDSPDPAHGNG
jgi:CRP/FNR family transcriptional regulator, cyclic AMP receptor protein